MKTAYVRILITADDDGAMEYLITVENRYGAQKKFLVNQFQATRILDACYHPKHNLTTRDTSFGLFNVLLQFWVGGYN